MLGAQHESPTLLPIMRPHVGMDLLHKSQDLRKAHQSYMLQERSSEGLVAGMHITFSDYDF